MQFLRSRPRRSSGPVDVNLKATPHQQSPYTNVGYSATAGFLPPQASAVTMPQTPPPEYRQYDDRFLNPMQPSIGYDSTTNGQVPAWASTSTIDVRPQTAGAWGNEQSGQRRPDYGTRPTTSGNAASCVVARGMNQGAAFCDRMASRLHDMRFRGEVEAGEADQLQELARDLDAEEDNDHAAGPSTRARANDAHRAPRQRPGSGVMNSRKAWMYRNSRLPPGMIPFTVYLPTWALVCRAAENSLEVYNRPKNDLQANYTEADPKQGTKATIIKSQTVDDRKLLIVAIRGSQWNIVDWTVNFGFAPTPPVGFLDDEGNACHAGFLDVARAMVSSVAAQLRSLIENDPSWASSSIMFTGHSAGGAVASLLYMHMLAKTIVSDLTALAGLFRRIHCITFGVPPVSLLTLQLPNGKSNERNLFLSFANEGDFIVRADLAYLLSLAKLIAAPAPSTGTRQRLREKVSRQNLRGDAYASPARHQPPRWPVPEASLSTAGRMVLLREKPNSNTHAVEAVQVSDDQLRGVIFGDRKMHSMILYKQRVDDLAFAAVSGRDSG